MKQFFKETMMNCWIVLKLIPKNVYDTVVVLAKGLFISVPFVAAIVLTVKAALTGQLLLIPLAFVCFVYGVGQFMTFLNRV